MQIAFNLVMVAYQKHGLVMIPLNVFVYEGANYL